MIWTLVLFLFTMWVLSKVAFPKIQEALDKRAKTIAESIEAAERQRKESDELLEEYRQRLAEAREQADDIMARARKAAETAEAEATAPARRNARSWSPGQARHRGRDAALAGADPQGGRRPTVLATEKVTRKSLTAEDQRRLVEEALSEVDFTSPLGGGEQQLAMAEAARVYAEALFDVAKEKGKLDAIGEQLGQFADAVDGDRELQVFFFSPYFSSAEKVEGLKRAVSGADPELVNFLELLIEKHRMPEIFRIRRAVRASSGSRRTSGIDVTVTSAVELDPAVVEKIGEEIERQTGQKVELASRVDDEILGGIVLQVGNMVLDASIRSRLEKLRKSVAQAA